MMTLPTAQQFRQHLESFIDYYQGLDPVDPDRLQQGELRSEVMFKEDKKYHIDLKVRLVQNVMTFLAGQDGPKYFFLATS